VTILIVDDDPVDREIFMRYLDADRPGIFSYAEAETGRDGLRKAEALRPNCILLDFSLPDLDGLNVVRLLCQGSDTLPCAVVMLTGTGNEEVAVEAMKLGVMDYMAKGPASAYALSRTVASAIRGFRLRSEVARQRIALERRNLELEAVRAELFAEKERYRILAEAIPQLVWISDSSGCIDYGNQRLWEFTGKADSAQCALESLVHADDATELRSITGSRLAKGVAWLLLGLRAVRFEADQIAGPASWPGATGRRLHYCQIAATLFQC
jgi:FixJ family two-component response regulator